jgi:hypothetical protein
MRTATGASPHPFMTNAGFTTEEDFAFLDGEFELRISSVCGRRAGQEIAAGNSLPPIETQRRRIIRISHSIDISLPPHPN